MSDLQRSLYDAFGFAPAGQAAMQSIKTEASDTRAVHHVFQSLDHLRKLVAHPALVLKTEDQRKQAFAKLDSKEKSSLTDIQHAPKLLALRYVRP
jgi:TATA-binding protein-associated factor